MRGKLVGYRERREGGAGPEMHLSSEGQVSVQWPVLVAPALRGGEHSAPARGSFWTDR